MGQVILDPSNTKGLYAASINGGVWKTTDFTTSLTSPSSTQWQTGMDQLPSLAMGGLAVDPLSAQHLVAGSGCFSSSGSMCAGVDGLIYESHDSGNSWLMTGKVGEEIQAVAVRGDNILVATGASYPTYYPRTNTTYSGSIYRRAPATNTFVSVLPAGIGPVYDLVADPSHSDRYFAIVGNKGGMGGVYV